jgi:hypothetical protein
MLYQGHRARNESYEIIREYIDRQSLAELGYSFNGDNLDTFTGECFIIISDEIRKIRQEKSRKKKRGRYN